MTLGRYLGIARSLGLYYGIPLRARRMRRFYAGFVPANGLCFDVGAHAGNRVRCWRSLGARVVAVEPQPDFVRILQRLFGRDPAVTVLATALGAADGEARLWASARTPTVSTLSQAWLARVGDAPSFRGVSWRSGPLVPVTTLDALIERFGAPDFVKVDVEGMEGDVLAGVSQPLKALSFEYLPVARDLAIACVERLAALGDYAFNWSPGEALKLGRDRWCGAREICRWLEGLPEGASSGDVYARLGAAR